MLRKIKDTPAIKNLTKTIKEKYLEKNQNRDILDRFQDFLKDNEFKNIFKPNAREYQIKAGFNKMIHVISLFVDHEENAETEEETKIKLCKMAIFAISNKVSVSNHYWITKKNEAITEGFQELIDEITENKSGNEKHEADLKIWSEIEENLKPEDESFFHRIILPNLEENIKKLSLPFKEEIKFYKELASKKKCDYTAILVKIKTGDFGQEQKKLKEKELGREEELKNKFQISSISNQQTQEIATRSRESKKRNSPAVRRSSSIENEDSSLKKSQNSFDDETGNKREGTSSFENLQNLHDIDIEYGLVDIFSFENLQNSLYIETESESESSSDTTYSDEDKKSLVKSQVGFFNSSTEGLQNDLPLPAICLTNINSINTQQLNATMNKESRKRDSSVVSESNFIESEDLFLEDSQNSLYIETESESESSFSGIYSLKDDDDYTDNRELPPNTGNKRRNQGRGSGSLF